jgi:hypothetical protein
MRRLAAVLAVSEVTVFAALPASGALAGGMAVVAPDEIRPADCVPGTEPRLSGAVLPGTVVIGCADAGGGADALIAARPDDGPWECYFAAPEGSWDVDGSCWREPQAFEIQRIHSEGPGAILVAGIAGPEVHEISVYAPPSAPPAQAGMVAIPDAQAAYLGIEPGFSYFAAALPRHYDTCRGFTLVAWGDHGIVGRHRPRRSHDVPLPASKECRAPAILAMGVARMLLPWL